MLTDVRVTGGLDTAVTFLKGFGRKAKKIMNNAIKEMAISSANLLSANITAGRVRPELYTGTHLKRMTGKEQGAVWPPVASYTGGRPLYRSGALAKSIAWERRGKMHYVVGVVEGTQTAFSGGRLIPLPEIALLQETGFIHTVPLTFRMQAYLLAVYGKITKKPSSHLADGVTGREIIVWVSPRPIWEQTHDSITKGERDLKLMDAAMEPLFSVK
jgi:hypothetical protein